MVPSRVFKIVLLCAFTLLHLESNASNVADSLQKKDFKYLFTMIRSLKNKPEKQDIYLKAFLGNAKAGGDWELIMNGYKNYADNTEGEMAFTYTDSMVFAALKSGKDELVGSAYLSKGIAYYADKKHELALENYLLAKPYIEKANDKYLTYKLKYNIGHVKYYLGKNDQAIELFNACLEYFKINNERAYLNTLHSLGMCYNREGNYGKSEEMVKRGLSEGARLENHSMDAYFLNLQGQNNYFRGNYALAIQTIKQAIPELEQNHDHANIAVANFFIGKSYWAVKRYREALPFLLKVDAVFEQKDYIRPDLRENYELLIDYYKNKDDSGNVLIYVDKLLKVDSLLLETHDKLYDNIHINYDTKELIQEKQRVEKELSGEISSKRYLLAVTGFIVLISVVALVVYERNRRRQNRIFKQLLEDNKKVEFKPAKGIAKELGIAQETLDKVLRLLEKWEKGMRFLDQDITQTSLAVYLETNVRYVSDIILNYRGKKFSEYVNDLKVDYIVEQLKTDKQKRMFTHDALAEEAGFSTTQRFVQAFKSRTGLSPNFFSAKIRKEIAETGT